MTRTILIALVVLCCAVDAHADDTGDTTDLTLGYSVNRLFSFQSPVLSIGIRRKDFVDISANFSGLKSFGGPADNDSIFGRKVPNYYSASLELSGKIIQFNETSSISLGVLFGYMNSEEKNYSSFTFCDANSVVGSIFSTLNYAVTKNFEVNAGLEYGKALDDNNDYCNVLGYVDNTYTAQTIAGVRVWF